MCSSKASSSVSKGPYCCLATMHSDVRGSAWGRVSVRSAYMEPHRARTDGRPQSRLIVDLDGAGPQGKTVQATHMISAG